MKTRLFLVILSALVVSSASALGVEQSDEVYNAAGKKLMEQVKAALTELSKTVPCLVGIEKVEITGPTHEVGMNQTIYFQKDVHMVKAVQGIYPHPNEDGIVFAMGISQRPPMMAWTKGMTLRKGHSEMGFNDHVLFMYSVETGTPEAKKLIVAELEKLSAPILQSLTEAAK